MNADKEKPFLFSVPLICKENNSKDILVGRKIILPELAL
jgi:hypothetical protein